MRIAAVFLAVLGFALMCADARADTIPFSQITGSGGADVAEQLSVDITADDDQIWFRFLNDSGVVDDDAIITAVYFHDTLEDCIDFGTAGITSSNSSVQFSAPASPGQPPSNPWKVASDEHVAYSMDAESPPIANGVEVDEWVQVCFDWADGYDASNLSDVLDMVRGGDLGLHVQNIDPNGFNSQTFLSAPEPGSIVLLGMGLAGVAAVRRRRKRLA